MNAPRCTYSLLKVRPLYSKKLGDPHDALAVLTALLVAVTGGLWVATRSLVKGAETTAQRQLRAYVFVEGEERPDHVPIIDAIQGMISVPFVIRNRGLTPAYKMRRWTRVEILPYPLTAPLEMNPISGSVPLDLGPSTPVYISAVRKRAWSTAEINGTLSGRLRIYIYGQIDYFDTFEKPQYGLHPVWMTPA